MTASENQKNLKGYLIIWFGQLISLFGSGVVQFAIIWWIATLTANTFILALVSFAGLLPMVIFTPISGVLADRWDRKYIIMGTDFIQAFLTLVLILLFQLQLIGIILIIIMLFLRGMLQAIQLPATIAIVSQMVPKKQINRMNGLNSIFNNLIYILTPIVGALLIEVSTTELILWIDILTFLIAVGSLAFVSVPSHKKANSIIIQNPNRITLKGQFMEGFIYLKKNGFILIIIGGMFANILINPLFSLLPFFIKYIHHGGAIELAIIMGSFQAGSLIGAILITTKNFIPQFKNILIAVFTAFLGLFLTGIAPVGFYLIIALGCLIAGISIGTVDIMIISLFQTYIPTELQGRVFSILFMLVKSILPFAILLTGTFAEIVGISLIYFINPILGFILVLYLAIQSKASELDHSLIQRRTSNLVGAM